MGGAHFSAPHLLESIVPPGAYPRDIFFDDGNFKSLYEQLERVLYEDSFHCEAVAPLQGLFGLRAGSSACSASTVTKP